MAGLIENNQVSGTIKIPNKLIPYTKDTIVGVQNAKEYLGVGLTPIDILKLYNKYENFRDKMAEMN